MAGTINVKTTDRGYNAIMRTLRSQDKKQIIVGVHSGSGTYPGGVNLADVAMFNEFGTSRAPARSFLRSTFDKQWPNWEKLIVRLEKAILRPGVTGGETRLFNAVGVKMQADVQRTIQQLRSPGLAASTIAKKKSSKPLIDKGQLIQSITYKVTGVGPLTGVGGGP